MWHNVIKLKRKIQTKVLFTFFFHFFPELLCLSELFLYISQHSLTKMQVQYVCGNKVESSRQRLASVYKTKKTKLDQLKTS